MLPPISPPPGLIATLTLDELERYEREQPNKTVTLAPTQYRVLREDEREAMQ